MPDTALPPLARADGVLPEGGTVRPIVRWGEPIMHRTQEPIVDFDEWLRALAADMVATMYAADGVGLAACQIGVDRAIFVFDCHDDAGDRHAGVVCNPELWLPEGKDRRLVEEDEGCLSLAGAYLPCSRPDYAEVVGQDLHGTTIRWAGRGMLARCFQHETDHCNGTVFGDRLNKRQRKKLFRRADSVEHRYPDDWPVSPAATPDDAPAYRSGSD